jgi:hypothetical protein
MNYTLVGKGMSSLMKVGVWRKSSGLLGSVTLAFILDMPRQVAQKTLHSSKEAASLTKNSSHF